MSEEPQDSTGLRYYGSDMTIHTTGVVDVELDEQGKVVSVWFRCQPLPFTETVADRDRAGDMRRMYAQGQVPAIEAVVLREEKA